MRTGSERGSERGRSLAWVLAALGTLLIVVALALATLNYRDAGALRHRGPASESRPVAVPPGRPPAPAVVRRDAGAGQPVRLSIPALGVSVSVRAVELRGAVLVPPRDPQVLGWWAAGGVPGASRGTTVIAGHTVHTGGGAFDDLADLGRGDRLRVTTPHGELEYRVLAVSVYSKASLAAHAEQLFSQSAPGRLALVTCEDWNGTTYESNAVVLATPIRGGGQLPVARR